MYKIYLRDDEGHIVAGKLQVPLNPCGGVRTLVCSRIGTFWTGPVHLTCTGKVTLQICDASSVYWRSTLDETDEEWTLVAQFGREFTGLFYPYWSDAAKTVETFIKSH